MTLDISRTESTASGPHSRRSRKPTIVACERKLDQVSHLHLKWSISSQLGKRNPLLMSSTGCDTPQSEGISSILPSQLIAPRRRSSCSAASTAAMPPKECPAMATRSVGKGLGPRWGSNSATEVTLLSWSSRKDTSSIRGCSLARIFSGPCTVSLLMLVSPLG